VLERSFIYFPERELIGDPAEFGLAFDDAYFTAGDGVRLHGWFVPGAGGSVEQLNNGTAPPSEAVPLFQGSNVPAVPATWLWFHGNAGNTSDRLENLRLLHDELGVNVFIFDYRGYGRSEGSPSEHGTYRDAEAALAYLLSRSDVEPERIVYFGRSLGSAVAVELATRETPRGLILEAPFTSVRAMGKAVFPFLPISLLVGNQFDSLGRISRVRAPLLILHGDRDEVVPFQQGEALYRAANEPKTFLRIPGAGHNDLVDSGAAAYLGAWSRFLDGLGDPAVPPGRP